MSHNGVVPEMAEEYTPEYVVAGYPNSWAISPRRALELQSQWRETQRRWECAAGLRLHDVLELEHHAHG